MDLDIDLHVNSDQSWWGECSIKVDSEGGENISIGFRSGNQKNTDDVVLDLLTAACFVIEDMVEENLALKRGWNTQEIPFDDEAPE